MFSAESAANVPVGTFAAVLTMMGRLAEAIRSASGRWPVAAEERLDCATTE